MEETKKALVLESGAKGVTTLHELITTTNAKAVERHGSPFPAGQAPSRLGGSNLYYQPTDPTMASLLNFAMASKQLAIAWVSKRKEDGKLSPQGVAVVTRTQLIMKLGATHEFA